MTPQLSALLGTRIQIDNSLFSIPVVQSDLNNTEDAVKFVQGIAHANNLDIELVETGFVLKGKDFAKHTTLLQGKLSPEFKASATKLGWDIFPLGGANVIEYPVAHKEIVETLSLIPRVPYSFQINITIIENDSKNNKGFRLSELISLSVSNFDLLRFRKPITLLNAPTLSYQRDLIDYLQDNTINLSLTCMGGNEVIQRIDKTNSVLTTSRDTFGQTVTQNVTNFTSGFILKLSAYPSNQHCLVDIDIELSSDTSKQVNQLPEISRKQVINSGHLKIGEVWKCAEFQSMDITKTEQSSFFLPLKSNKTNEQTLIVTIKRIT